MSKELERAYNSIESELYDSDLHYQKCSKSLDIVYNAVQRLKQIDNAVPSEAMKCLDTIKEVNCDEDNSIGVIYYDECNTIKQALLKAQEQDKVLKILFEKNVEISEFKNHYFKDYEDYKTKMNIRYSQYGNIEWDDENYVNSIYLLTQEEFDLLKRYFNKH